MFKSEIFSISWLQRPSAQVGSLPHCLLIIFIDGINFKVSLTILIDNFQSIFKRKPSGQPTNLFRNIFCQPQTRQFSIFFYVGAQAPQAFSISRHQFACTNKSTSSVYSFRNYFANSQSKLSGSKDLQIKANLKLEICSQI